MRRLAIAVLSLAWMAVFATGAWFCLLAAEDGVAATAASFHVSAASEAIAASAGRPALAGLCFGAAVVVALFATVLVSTLLNGEKDIAQGRFIADMAFGGGFGLAGLSAAGLLTHSAFVPASIAVLAGGALLASFLLMRAAMADREEPADPLQAPARWRALDAAAQINVIRFPVERAVGIR